MLVRIPEEQVSQHWDYLSYGFEHSLPPGIFINHSVLNNLLKAALEGRMQCWVSLSDQDKPKIDGMVATTIQRDAGSGIPNLVIYSIFGFNSVSRKTFKEGLGTLKQFAKVNKCNAMLAYTQNEKVVKLAEAIGATNSIKVLQWEI